MACLSRGEAASTDSYKHLYMIVLKNQTERLLTYKSLAVVEKCLNESAGHWYIFIWGKNV